LLDRQAKEDVKDAEGGHLEVHEVAEAGPGALARLVLREEHQNVVEDDEEDCIETAAEEVEKEEVEEEEEEEVEEEVEEVEEGK
jgi:hypothetical protein